MGDLAGSLNRGYRMIRINGVRYQASRLAWLHIYGCWPTNHIDHINRNPADNRISNLRDVNQTCNMHNAATYSSNTSGHPGVSWYPPYHKWVAYINKDKKRKTIGYFREKEAAIAAYKAASLELYGTLSPYWPRGL
jgi:hypothetical protein